MRGAFVQAAKRFCGEELSLRECRAMRELLRTNDVVLISAVEALLAAAEIPCLLTDAYFSSVEGSIGVLPRRILVLDEDMEGARSLLAEAGFKDALPDEEPDDGA